MTTLNDAPFGGLVEDSRGSIADAPVDYLFRTVQGAEELVCFMPSALGPTQPRRVPSYFRWKWADQHFADTNVLVLADPAMRRGRSLLGAWYMHPEQDVLADMATTVEDVATDLGVKRVLFYGSSLGGFGALAMASMVERSTAIAEVPQIDVAHWFVVAVRAIEDEILGTSIEAHRSNRPEQVRLQDRLWRAGRMPDFTIVTNPGDRSYDDQRAFVDWCAEAPLRRTGRQRLLSVDSVDGHRILPEDDSVAMIRRWLAGADA